MMDALVIVAHPDDETIWMGGTILKEKNFRWTIFSLCRGNDPDRSPKFKQACRHYNAQSIITDIEDNGIMTISQSVPLIRSAILKNLPKKNFSYIFTHNNNGEYGHPRHKGVYRAVTDLIKEKKLAAEKVMTFAYLPAAKPILASPLPAAPLQKILPQNIFKEKQFVMSDIYGFQKTTPDYQTAGPRETFSFLK